MKGHDASAPLISIAARGSMKRVEKLIAPGYQSMMTRKARMNAPIAYRMKRFDAP